MDLIFIPGIRSRTEDTYLWRDYAHVLNGNAYLPTDFKKINKLKDEARELITPNTAIIGHSYGGLIAKTLGVDMNRIITLATPNISFNPMVSDSFSGLYDWLVPPYFAHQSTSYKHILPCGHCDFVSDEKTIETVLKQAHLI